MPLTISQLPIIGLPQVGIGAASVHRAAEGMRELGQMQQQRRYQDAMVAQAAQNEAGRNARALADNLVQRDQMEHQRATAARSALDDFTKALLEPGGAARARERFPSLKGHGLTFEEQMAPAPPDLPGAPPRTAPADPIATGRYNVRRGEEDFGEVDITGLNEQDAADTRAMMGELRNLGGSPQKRMSVEQAIMGNPTLRGPKALEEYRKTVDPALNRDAAAQRTAQMASAQRASGQRAETNIDSKAVKDFEMMVRQNTNSIATRFGAKALNDEERAIEASLAGMQSGNPISQNDAILSKLKAQQGGRISDADYRHALSNAGLLYKIQNALKNIAGGGLVDDYRDLFIQAGQILQDVNDDRRARLAQQVGDYFRQDAFTARFAAAAGMTPEDAAARAERAVYDMATGDIAPPGAAPEGDPGDGGDGSADAEFEALKGQTGY